MAIHLVSGVRCPAAHVEKQRLEITVTLFETSEVENSLLRGWKIISRLLNGKRQAS
jgi:hypothetical protein